MKQNPTALNSLMALIDSARRDVFPDDGDETIESDMIAVRCGICELQVISSRASELANQADELVKRAFRFSEWVESDIVKGESWQRHELPLQSQAGQQKS